MLPAAGASPPCPRLKECNNDKRGAPVAPRLSFRYSLDPSIPSLHQRLRTVFPFLDPETWLPHARRHIRAEALASEGLGHTDRGSQRPYRTGSPDGTARPESRVRRGLCLSWRQGGWGRPAGEAGNGSFPRHSQRLSSDEARARGFAAAAVPETYEETGLLLAARGARARKLTEHGDSSERWA